jgi:hypothetical protein
MSYRQGSAECGKFLRHSGCILADLSSQIFNRILAPYIENLDMNLVNYGKILKIMQLPVSPSHSTHRRDRTRSGVFNLKIYPLTFVSQAS